MSVEETKYHFSLYQLFGLALRNLCCDAKSIGYARGLFVFLPFTAMELKTYLPSLGRLFASVRSEANNQAPQNKLVLDLFRSLNLTQQLFFYCHIHDYHHWFLARLQRRGFGITLYQDKVVPVKPRFFDTLVPHVRLDRIFFKRVVS